MVLTDVGLFSHLLAFIGFSALAIAVLWRRPRTTSTAWLAFAAAMTALWALAFVLSVTSPASWTPFLTPAGTLRTAAWIGFLVAVLRPTWRLDDRLRSSFVIATAMGFIVSLQLVLDLTAGTFDALGGDRSLVSQLFIILRLTVSVSGLVMVHNLYVNTDTSARGGVRLLAIGLGGMFLYDLNMYTLAFLLPPISPDLYNIRGAVYTLTVPLLLLSARETWISRVQVSRQVVFHTLSFSMIGIYLIVMALLAYGLRLFGGDWGRLFQISFLFATCLLGALVLVSPRFRAALRVMIAQNFFAYRYDYRVEWLRFIKTVSVTGATNSAEALNDRVIQAVCTVLDSPGGILFVADEDNLVPIAEWQVRNLRTEAVSRHGGLGRFLEQRQRIVVLDEVRAGIGEYDGTDVPAWLLENQRLWLCVPLVHLDNLVGFLLLERTLAPRELNWEDFELLRTLGRQAASYIAESSTQMALDDAAKFDEFNRRFAFIMHDLKNLVSQLSLVARNAERHADNPEFRADMVKTLQNSVGKMNDMLARLSQRPSGRSDPVRRPVPIAALVHRVVEIKRLVHPPLTLAQAADESPDQCRVFGDAEQIEQLFLHLVQNAIDASAPDSPITVYLASKGSEVIVTIADKGIGMSTRFVRHDLFKPFRSTKPGGFGIGAYEAREIARAHDGRLEVVSREDEGTIFTVALPLAGVEIAVAAQ
ncbi:MAG: PEP-CTERM system histidine kinase PrsK [Sandarakinorhabdus sp.]|nr:PEP-CTERM system histidine kinase PrsK [Sandarakinorhabdus sp.]